MKETVINKGFLYYKSTGSHICRFGYNICAELIDNWYFIEKIYNFGKSIGYMLCLLNTRVFLT